MQFVGLAILLLLAAVVLFGAMTILLAYEAVRPPRRSAGYALGRGMPCDPSEIGFEYEEWSCDLADGTTVPVWDVRNTPANASQSMTAVFIHGWGRSRIDMLSWMKPYDEFCDRLIFYDLRGHGDASPGTSRLGCDEHQDLLALLGQLNDRHVVLVGHSMGAIIALQAAASTDDIAGRLAGVIAYGPYIDFHISLQGRLHTHRYPTRPMTDIVMLWFRLRGIRHRSTLDAVRTLRCPLLVLHGTEDSISPPGDAAAIVGATGNALLVDVEGAHHLNVRDANPQRHDRAVRDFMQALSSSGHQAVHPAASDR